MQLHKARLGIVLMKSLGRCVWWPGIDTDIENLTKNCIGCQNIANETFKAPVQCWEYPSKPI